MVGGDFDKYNGEIVSRLVRLNSDGSRDSSFNVGEDFNFNVRLLEIQEDGKILVGGYFVTFSNFDARANYIIRLNSDGSRDTSFNVGTGFSYFPIWSPTNNVADLSRIIIQPDGKILVGGWFENYNGYLTNNIIRLNSDGSIDNSFNIGTGFDGSINTISLQSDGKILAGGYFDLYNGNEVTNIMRLNTNGTIDTSFDIGTGFNGEVYTITQQSDGKILAGGWFYNYNGIQSNRIIRLNSDGSRDTSFDIGTGFNNQVKTITLQSDGKILIGGDFTAYKGDTANYMIRLNSDGSRDTSLNLGGSSEVLTNEMWKGDIAQVAIYDRALSNNEILQNFNSSKSKYGFAPEIITPSIVSTGLISYLDASNIISYPGSGNKWFDLSGNNNDAILYNGVRYNNNGGSFKFDGEDDTSIINLGEEITVTDLSYSAWVKTQDDVEAYRTVLDFDGEYGGGAFFMGSYDGEFMFYNQINEYYSSYNRFEPYTWYHLSMTYSNGNEIALYINGVLVYSEVIDPGYEYTSDKFSIGARTSITGNIVNSGFDSFVKKIYIQKNGRILAGGYFQKYQAMSSPYLIRLLN